MASAWGDLEAATASDANRRVFESLLRAVKRTLNARFSDRYLNESDVKMSVSSYCLGAVDFALTKFARKVLVWIRSVLYQSSLCG